MRMNNRNDEAAENLKALADPKATKEQKTAALRHVNASLREANAKLKEAIEAARKAK